MKKNEFMFDICIDERNYEESYVTIGTRRVWESEGYLNDHYTDEERIVINELEEFGILEVTDATFEFPSEMSEEELRELLLSKGLVEDKEFSTWLNN